MRGPTCIVFALLLAGLGACARERAAKPVGSEVEVLYTGKEARRKVILYFPATDKPGLLSAQAEIYQTASELNQLKQVLRLLSSGPLPKGAARPLPEGAWREAFLDGEGLVVLDLNSAVIRQHPGGSTAEYASLASLFRSLAGNFKSVSRLRVLVDGTPVESLAGHFDLGSAISARDF